MTPSLFVSAALVGHVAFPDDRPRIETSCVCPDSRPDSDRLTISLLSLSSSVPEPLTPELLRALSDVVKCCAAFGFGVGVGFGAGLPEAVNETHLPNAFAPVSHFAAKPVGPR